MNLRNYYNLNKETTHYLIKFCGILFTSLYLVVATITGFHSNSFTEAIMMFGICFVLGNSLGLFIFSLAFSGGYSQTKTTIHFFNSIPEEFKDKTGLKMYPKLSDKRFNYLQMEIASTVSIYPITFKYFNSKKQIIITTPFHINEGQNFQKLMSEIKKKYKNQRVTLNGWGLNKTVKLNVWKSSSSLDLENYINELLMVADKEKNN